MKKAPVGLLKVRDCSNVRCVTGSEDSGKFFIPDASQIPAGLDEAFRRWWTTGHLEAPAEYSESFGRDRVEALHLEHRFGCEPLRHSERRVHCHAERAVIVRRGTVVIGVLLLEGGELGVRVRDLSGAHHRDDQQADDRQHLQPDWPALARVGLEESLHWHYRRCFKYSCRRAAFVLKGDASNDCGSLHLWNQPYG